MLSHEYHYHQDVQEVMSPHGWLDHFPRLEKLQPTPTNTANPIVG